MKKIVIIDYLINNLWSVQSALNSLGYNYKISNDSEVIKDSSHLILPGVGAFGNAIKQLEEYNLRKPIIEYAKLNKPLLGICLGMQILLTTSYEFGVHKGLGLIDGEVVKISNKKSEKIKIPHIGWNNLNILATDHPLFADIREGAHAYFVHSYGFECAAAANRLATADYGGPVTAAIGRDNMVGTQFHPEKSQSVGLRLIANFLKWRP